jgi:hypothetical protein
MNSASVILVLSGIACLLASGYMMYRLIPREGQASSSWIKSDSGETTMALGQFILMVAGVALLAKGIV